MSDKTGIQWTQATWNPVIGCAKVSAGCKNCYAEKQGYRISQMSPKAGYLDVINTDSKKWNGRAKFMPERLDQPIRWQKPRTIFVNSMSDLFHEDVTFDQIAAVFGVMGATPQHTYQILTKRPQRMKEFFKWLRTKASVRGDKSPRELCAFFANEILASAVGRDAKGRFAKVDEIMPGGADWPLPNVHLGVSVEDQAAADKRIPLLLECPAALRFLSMEPLLGETSIDDHLESGDIGWVIIGGESGPGARRCDRRWIRHLVKRCYCFNVPCFVKQMGKVSTEGGLFVDMKHSKGGDPSEWPEDLRVREMPR